MNNIFETTDGVSNEIVTESDTLGQLFVVGIILVLAVFVISLFLGIPQKLLKGLSAIMKNMKM